MFFFFFQAEDGIRDRSPSRGLGDVYKRQAPAVFDVLAQAVDGTFSKDPYVGTLENGGVALAPFHDFDGAISDELKREIDQLKVDIIAGDIVVESAAIP